MRPRTLHPVTPLLAFAAFGAIAFLTLGPRSVIAPLRSLFLQTAGVALYPWTAWVEAIGTERVLNALMFVPLGAVVALVLPRRWGMLGALAGFVVSATVEILQRDVPGRVSDPADVVWNTLGAAVGAVIVVIVRTGLAGARAAAARRRHAGSAAGAR